MKSFDIRLTFVAACLVILSACGGTTAPAAFQGGESAQRSAEMIRAPGSVAADGVYTPPPLVDGLAEESRAAASERKVEAGDDAHPAYPQVPASAVAVVETYQQEPIGDEGN